MGVIYLRTNRINGKKYVGQATDLEVRQRAWNCISQPYAGPAINAARAKYGIEAFGFEILKECKDEELDYWEKYYIKELNTKAPYGYNLTDGGDGKNGCPVSGEAKKKISEALKGRKKPPRSEEHKKHLSEAKKNGKLSKPLLQINKYTNEVIAEFPSLMQVQRDFGYDNGAISKCCKGKLKSAYNFIWKYKESVA